MNHLAKFNMLKRRQNILYSFICAVGLFLHLLLWDVNFLARLSRMFDSWDRFKIVFIAIWDWFNIYLVQGIGIWMLITALMMLFVVLPMLTRYKYVQVRPNIWLAINTTIYLFLIMKMLNLY